MTGYNPGDVTSPRWAGGTPAAVETELKTLRAERDAALKALAESRARFGDVEARLVEAEAALAKVGEICDIPLRVKVMGSSDAESAMAALAATIKREALASPSVVLADRDKAVRQVALREAAEAVDSVEFYFQYHNDQKYLIPTDAFSRAIRALAEGDTNA
jgi:hypothetical protein